MSDIKTRRRRIKGELPETKTVKAAAPEPEAVKTPWEKSTGGIPLHLEYFDCSMYEAIEKVAKIFPRYTAIDFMGKSTSYSELIKNINDCAKSLKTLAETTVLRCLKEKLKPKFMKYYKKESSL